MGFEAGESQPGKRLQGATRNVSTRFESLPSHSETPSEARRLGESSGGPASEASGTSSDHGSDGERSEPRDTLATSSSTSGALRRESSHSDCRESVPDRPPDCRRSYRPKGHSNPYRESRVSSRAGARERQFPCALGLGGPNVLTYPSMDYSGSRSRPPTARTGYLRGMSGECGAKTRPVT